LPASFSFGTAERHHERGFDLLGYRYTRAGLNLSVKTIDHPRREGIAALGAKVPRGLITQRHS
jgi:hypothetical protein